MPTSSKKTESLSAFGDKSACPNEQGLRGVLGPAASTWDALIAHVEKTFPPVTRQWSFSGAKYGWSLRLKKRDRAIVYLTPQAGRILVGLALGARAVAAAESADLPDDFRQTLRDAPKYAEGTGLRLTIVDESVLPAVQQLIAAKMA